MQSHGGPDCKVNLLALLSSASSADSERGPGFLWSTHSNEAGYPQMSQMNADKNQLALFALKADFLGGLISKCNSPSAFAML
jgi:hypothetical protein